MTQTIEPQTNFSVELQQLWQMLVRRWKPASIGFVSILGLAAAVTVIQGPSFEAKGKILLERSNASSNITESGKLIGDLRSIGNNDPLNTEIEIMRSMPMIQKMIESLQLRSPNGELLDPEALVTRSLRLRKIPGSDVLQVTYRSKDAKEAARVVNYLMQLYLDERIAMDRQQATNTRQFILGQLPVSEQSVRQLELALRQFKEKNRVSDLAKEEDMTLTTVAELKRQLANAHTQLKTVQSRLGLLQQHLQLTGSEPLTTSILSQTPGVQKALEELQSVETELAVARNKYQDSHPLVRELSGKQQQLQQIVQGRAETALQGRAMPSGNWQSRGLQQDLMTDYMRLQLEARGLTSQIQSLKTESQGYEQRLRSLPRLEQQRRQLESKLEAAQTTYQTLLKRLQEVKIAANQDMGNARIIESAQIPEKFLPLPILLKLGAGSLLGALVFILIVGILEFQDKSLKTIRQAQELFGFTLLGVIPAFGKALKGWVPPEEGTSLTSQVIVREHPRSTISEAYRMLQSNLQFMSSDKELKVIVITSTVGGEGKSTTCANLAVAMAQRGRRVLVVDADMHCPNQHHFWNLSNSIGLSHILVGKATLKTWLHPVMDNLHVLTAGVLPPNPGALLGSKRMDALIQHLASNYDHVIIDSPCLSAADDPRLLSKLADGMVLVVRPELLDVEDVAIAKEQLRQLENNVLGLVINGVEPEREYSNLTYKERESKEQDPKSGSKAKIGVVSTDAQSPDAQSPDTHPQEA
jgi:polysaccharide biosynthesis transport protein